MKTLSPFRFIGRMLRLTSSRRFLLLFIFVGLSFVTLFLMAAAIPRPDSSPAVSLPQVNEWHVCQSGGADFTTIQAAVDAAQPGDTIKVAAATYIETKMVSGTPFNLYITKTLIIRGGYTCADFTNQNPFTNATIIRPSTSTESVVSIFGVFGTTSQVAPTIDGFTVTGGGGGNHGGGISMRDSDATISNNIISGNTGYLLGGGIYVQRGIVRIQYNRIQNNTADGQNNFALGGGIEMETAAGSLRSNVIANNTFTVGGTKTGGGVDINGGGPVVLANNTIVGNAINGVNASIALTLVNNIVMTHPVGVSAGATTTTSYNIYFGNTTNTQGFALSGTDLTVNPQLTSDYHLNASSPAIDAGTHMNAPSRDIDREPRAMIGNSGLYKIDIGADEFTGVPQTIREITDQPADFTLIGPGNPVENPGSTGPNEWIGYSVAGADVNGDNRADLLTGAFNHADDFDNGIADSGRVYSLYGNGMRRLGVVDFFNATPSLEVRSYLDQQHIGSSLTAADLNNDSTRDLIIGASGAANFNVKGSVFVFQGGAGLSGIKTLSPTNQTSWQFRSAEATSSFAAPNALAAGKLSNDAIDDLVIAEGNATGPGGRAGAGAVFVFFGSASLPALWDLATMPASLTIYGPATNAGLGVVAVGDVNGDGKLDLIARTATNAYIFYGPLAAGTIDLASTAASAIITGLTNDWVAAGDVDGDGKADIVLGLTNETDVVRGGTLVASQTIGAAAAIRLTGVTTGALHAFDWNADGKAEVGIGDPLNNRTFIVFGGALSGTADVADRAKWIITGEIASDKFGFSIGSGDLDTDGTADLIVGVRQHNVTNHTLHFEDAGTVYVFYGTPVPLPSQVVSRKLHGGTPFDINLPLTGNPGIECRSGGTTNDYQVVLTFPSAVTFTNAAITAGTGSVNGSMGSGTNTVTVNLTGIVSVQRVTITLLGVNNGTTSGDLGVTMGVLVGDTNGNGNVNASDVSQTKTRVGQLVDATNFRSDLNVNGSINASDVTLLKSRSGTALP
ncbi:MAG TPA: FG-GAP-like repeat-containing protein [Candidatus Udaeobacter sp.]|nr:FG-GAP-like repeat-containing protein [Candidatus Udaeobacter sp.]